jgi:hypothetical protein
VSIRRLSAVLLCALLLTACVNRPAPPAQVPTVAPPAPTAAAPTSAAPAAPTAAVPSAVAQPSAAPIAGTGAPTRTLALRDPHLEGEDVRVVQRRLLDLGYRQAGQADGLYGPQTEAAVRAFQQVNALEADGVLGPQTGARLFAGSAVPAWTVVPIAEGVLCGKDRSLIGASAGDAWLKNETAGAMLRGGETYRLYDSAGSLGTATGSAPKLFTEPPLAGAYAVRLTPDPDDRPFIAVGGAWEPRPRPIGELTGAADRERAAALVADYLRGAGIAKPVVQPDHVTALLQADLDGDGSQELLISAERSENDRDVYSVLLLQRQVGGALKLEALASSVHPGESDAAQRSMHRIFQVLDLNGDGRMEIVTRQSAFEWAGVTVYGIGQSGVAPLLETGCGV